MKDLKTLDPNTGDLLRCWWPHDDQPNQPGPKFRPVFFWGVAFVNGKKHFAVSYGTSQVSEHNEARNGGDIYVKIEHKLLGVLSKDTRFDFNKIKLIPVTGEYFAKDQGTVITKVTSVPKTTLGQIGDAMNRAGVAKRLKALNVTLK